MRPSAVPVGVALLLLSTKVGQGQGIPYQPRSQTEELQITQNELRETKDRLHAFEAENEALRRRNEQIKKSLQTLNESLAVANAESELFRRQFGELKLRMEALGMESVGDNKQALEERLLKAVRDLGLLREEKEKMSEKMVALTEAMLLYMKTAPSSDPQLRMDVEAQMRSVSQMLDESLRNSPATAAPIPDMNSGAVVSVKEDLSLLVLNIGSRNGVQVGIPFKVIRGDKLIAKARVIEVRERISGAVIEDFATTVGGPVKIGDRLHVDATQ